MYYQTAAAVIACYLISSMFRRDNAPLFLLGLFLINLTGSGDIAIAATLAGGAFGELTRLIDKERDK